MIIEIANDLRVIDPTPELIRWCKQNLEVTNPEYAKKLRMGFWTGNTPEKLDLYTKETAIWNGGRVQVYHLPYGTLSLLPIWITDPAVWVDRFTDSPTIDFNANVPLYDYQEKAVTAMINSRFGILQSAAGSGKTQMGIALAAKIGKRTLWLSHTLDLVKQSMDRAKMYMSDDLLGLISGGKVRIGAGITFATIQTMAKLDLTRYKDYWDCIIVDEVHRVSGSPTATTQYLKVLNALSARHKYGLSATVHRSDGLIQATYALVGTVAYQVPDSAIADRIMKVGIKSVSTGTKIDDCCLNPDGTLNYTSLITYLTENNRRNALIASCIERRPSLILSHRLDHLKILIRLLPEDMQKESVMISGKMTTKKGKAEREQAIEDMKTGKKKYLFATYSLAKEGLDIPCLERLYMATPQKDYAIVAQSIGRVARVCEGKAEPVCYDFVDDIGYLVRAYHTRWTHYWRIGAYEYEE